jgi:hypothetical protein
MKSKDGEIHSLECEADSLFSAAEKGIQQWAAYSDDVNKGFRSDVNKDRSAATLALA